MSEPIITLRSTANPATEITSWPLGVVDAGVPSEELALDIWNNYGGAVDVSNMQNVKITLKDSSGGDALDTAREKWTQVKNVSKGESAFTAIGGSHGVNYADVGTVGYEHTIGAASVDAGEIGGYANDGDKATANTKKNFVSLLLRMVPPLNAKALGKDAQGNPIPRNFLVKWGYQYT